MVVVMVTLRLMFLLLLGGCGSGGSGGFECRNDIRVRVGSMEGGDFIAVVVVMMTTEGE